MSEFPFQLVVKRTYPENNTESLMCIDLLRIVPGRRSVYDALLNQRSVIAKVFSHRLSAKRHLRREWRGLRNLASRKINMPNPLFYGQTEDGQWVVVVEKIAESVTALDLFDKLKNSTEKLELLILVAREMAKQHMKGVLQKDLHLGNFLIRDDTVFTLDAGQMQFLHGQIGRKKSVAQLAMLAAWLPGRQNEATATLCKEYFKVRDWRFGESEEILFHNRLALYLKRAINKGLRKSLRTSKRHLKIQNKKNVAVFDRSLCLKMATSDFIDKIDVLMDTGEILKNGNTCYVSRLIWNDREIVIKRYNHKSSIHSLRQTIRRSRARRCWLHGHRLGMLNISTPKPLAYIENRRGFLIWKSYFITEYVKGLKLYHFLRDNSISEKQRSCVMKQMNHILDEMEKGRITHGDLKHTNILITNNGPVLTDLDAMRVHKYSCSYRIRRAKDLERIKWE